MDEKMMVDRQPEKRLFSFEVTEYETVDGGTDHRFEAHGGFGGLAVRFQTTVDQVRKFFAERRKVGEKAKLGTS